MSDPRIRTRCPSCGSDTLIIDDAGYLVCSLIGCKKPTMIGDAAAEIARLKADHESALAAAVQAEREAILSRLESMKSAALAHGVPDAIGLGLACGVVKGRGTVTPSISPTIPTVGEWNDQGSGSRFMIDDRIRALAYATGDWYTFTEFDQLVDNGRASDLESAKRAAVDALVRQGWYRETTATFDLVAHLYRQREFSERTFGPGGRTAGICDHIRKELVEVAKDPTIREWVDVIILALDGAWRSGATPEEIVAAIEAKQSTNEARTWPNWRTVPEGKAIEHDRTAEESSGVDDVAKRLMGFRLVADPSIPPGEIRANVDGYTAGKIVGMDGTATPEAREGQS